MGDGRWSMHSRSGYERPGARRSTNATINRRAVTHRAAARLEARAAGAHALPERKAGGVGRAGRLLG